MTFNSGTLAGARARTRWYGGCWPLMTCGCPNFMVLRLRSEVFVVEQQCIFHDMDGYDPQAMHLLGVQHGQLRPMHAVLKPVSSFPRPALADCWCARARVAPAWATRWLSRP